MKKGDENGWDDESDATGRDDRGSRPAGGRRGRRGGGPGPAGARPIRTLRQAGALVIGGGDREHIARKFMRRLKDRVGLSDQQAEDLRATLKASRDEARPDVQALCEARVDMRRLLDDRNSDPTAIKAAGDKVKALQGKLLDRRVDATVALRAKLTAEQWTKWVELRKEMARRFWHRRFHHWRHHHRRHHHDRERD